MSKFSKEEKLEAVRRRLEGGESERSIADSMGTGGTTIRHWVQNFEIFGAEAFDRSGNRHYSLEDKQAAVRFYLDGKGSLTDTCKRFKIPYDSSLLQWIKLYNDCELKASPGGGKSRVMTKGRKTTVNERIAIVEDHIKRGCSYDETAEKYKISYQQIYQWHHKYLERGIEGLEDRRGRTKPESEMTELEKMQAENRLLRAQLENKELEVEFLKKLREVERRWG